MTDKHYTVVKTVYMVVLGFLLIFIVKLFVFLLITGTGLGGFMQRHLGLSPRRFSRAVLSRRFTEDINVGGYDFSDFHIFNRRIEIDEALERIDINWQKGDIRIRSSSGVQKPYAQIKNGATNIVYKKSGGVLYIADKSGKTRFRFTGNARISGCDLEIVFPSDYTLNVLSISTVTGSIRLEEVRLHSADFASVNSDIRIFGYAEDIRINTVNGDAEIKSQGGLKRLAVQTVNSDIRLFVPQGEKVRVHDTVRSARVEFWNKDVKAAADEEAAEVSISSVHADVIVGKL